MKMIFDKIESGPPHSLSRSEANVLFSLLSEKLHLPVRLVHFSNQMHSNLTFDRPVIYSGDNRLTILSRGFRKLDIVKEILIELSQCGVLDPVPDGNIHGALYRNHLKKDDYLFFEKMVFKYLEQYRGKMADWDILPSKRESVNGNCD